MTSSTRRRAEAPPTDQREGATTAGALISSRAPVLISEPTRVSALILSDSAGLGRAVIPALGQAVSPALAALNSPVGQLAAALAKTRLGAAHRSSMRALLMFARPWQIPLKWLKDQYELAQRPNFTDAALASLRSAIGEMGQREVLLDRLPQLQMPTLMVWGIEDKVVPYTQAKEAIALVQDGSLELISNCGHLPHVEQPKRFVSTIEEFLINQPPNVKADTSIHVSSES